jgi:multicomponent Na+:H+ antiporter subunit F
MTVVVWIAAAMLGAAAVLVAIRIGKGPTMLNRVVALDVFTSIIVCGLCVEAAYNRHSTTLPVLVVLSLVGFVGSVSVARFASKEKLENHP